MTRYAHVALIACAALLGCNKPAPPDTYAQAAAQAEAERARKEQEEQDWALARKLTEERKAAEAAAAEAKKHADELEKKAQRQEGAVRLLRTAVEFLRNGNKDGARLAFKTIIELYPETTVADTARKQLKELDAEP
jgi:TolA-binding protein